MPSAATKDMYQGGKRPKGKVTTSNTRWEERIPKRGGGGLAGNFVIDCIMPNGETEELAIRVGPKEWYNGDAAKAYIEDGKFLDFDDDNPYQFNKNSEIGQFFETAQLKGVPQKLMSRICGEPSAFDGITFTLAEQPTGRKYKYIDDKNVERERDEMWIYVESVESVPGDKSASKKPAATAAKKQTPVAAVEDDTADDHSDNGAVDEDTLALIQFATAAINDPKGVAKIASWSKSQYNGGVQVKALKDTALNWIKETDKKKKTAMWTKLLKDSQFFDTFADVGGWTAPDENGVIRVAE